MNHLHHRLFRNQRGISLPEALIAMLVLSLGMLAVSRMQTQLRLGSDTARQRAEAVRIGQEDIEEMRAFLALAASGTARSHTGITSAIFDANMSTGHASSTRYTVSRQIEAADALAAKTVAVTVSWVDRAGDAQKIALNSIIAAHDPAYSGALGTSPLGTHAHGAAARSSHPPQNVRDLGNGSSLFKPTAAGLIAYVFDNASGRVTARCSEIDLLTATSQLGPAQLRNCVSINGQMLSGSVRFSQASPPDAARGNDSAPAFNVALGLTTGATGEDGCSTEPVQTTSGDRYVVYHCVVLTLPNGRWSGRSTIVPIGWLIGNAASERKVCRYSNDLDGSGAVDRNEEHPAAYRGVDRPLANQNFLVIKGSETCPTASGGAFVSLATALHQP